MNPAVGEVDVVIGKGTGEDSERTSEGRRTGPGEEIGSSIVSGEDLEVIRRRPN